MINRLHRTVFRCRWGKPAGTSHVTEAKSRLGALREERDWESAISSNTIEDYEDILSRHANLKYKDEVEHKLSILKEEKDWEKANSVNTIKSYREFINMYPHSIHAGAANNNITALEVEKIKKEKPQDLPFSNEPLWEHSRYYAVVNNDTEYELILRYVGVDTFKSIFQSNERASLEALNGTYTVTASDEAPYVKNYMGVMKYNGGDYQVTFYIAPPYRMSEFLHDFNQRMPVKRSVKRAEQSVE